MAERLKIRYFCADSNVDHLATLRKSQVSKKGTILADDTGDNVSQPRQCAIRCDPNRESTCSPGCPTWPTYSEQQPKASSKHYIEWCMSTKACYMPMLEPNYKGDTIHSFALQGKRAFHNLVDYVRLDPKAVHYRDSHGNTPLILACAAHDDPYDVVSFLLARSRLGLVNAENHEGLTALHFAVLNDRPEIVKLLLNRRAKVDAGSREIQGEKYGLTPLHLSLIDQCNTEMGRPESSSCFHILLEHGADVFIKMVEDSSRGASLRYECGCGGCWSDDFDFDSVVPPALIRLDGTQVAKGTAFDVAVSLNNYWQAEFLLRRYPNIDMNCKNAQGYSAFFHAIVNADGDMIRLLLNYGADINDIYDSSERPIHVYLSFTRQELEQKLQCFWCSRPLPHGEPIEDIYDSLLDKWDIDIDVRNDRGETPIYLAACHGHLHACRKLLDMGADPSFVHFSGQSLLHAACDLNPLPLRKAMMGTLLATGISYRLLSGLSQEQELLRDVGNNTDIESLQMLYRASAVSRDGLRRLLTEAGTWVNQGTMEERKVKEEFRQALKSMVQSPQPLKMLTLHHFSHLAGVGSSSQRASSLRRVDSDPKGAAYGLLLSLMRAEYLI